MPPELLTGSAWKKQNSEGLAVRPATGTSGSPLKPGEITPTPNTNQGSSAKMREGARSATRLKVGPLSGGMTGMRGGPSFSLFSGSISSKVVEQMAKMNN